jgi:hypothetical protein
VVTGSEFNPMKEKYELDPTAEPKAVSDAKAAKRAKAPEAPEAPKASKAGRARRRRGRAAR